MLLYDLICNVGRVFKNPWVYGFGLYIPRPMPTNPLGMTFDPIANPWV
jgi:hypothetical protein